MFALGGLGTTLGATAAESRFIATLGADRLPLFFVVSDLSITLLTLGLGRWGEKWRPSWPLRGLFGAALLVLLGFVQLADPAWAPACFGLFLLASVVRVMSFILLLTFLRAYLDLGRLRRDLPRLYGIGAVGNIVAGLAVPALVRGAGNPGLLYGWALCLAGQLVVLLSYERSFQPLPPEPVRAADREAPEQLRDYRLSLTLMGFVGTAVFLFRVMDFHSNSLLGKLYPTAEELSRFYGLFQAAGSLTAALMSAVITPMLLDRAGIGRSLLVLPAFALFTLVGLAIQPGLGPAIMARSLVHVLQGAILWPVLDILQSALPTPLANRLTMVLSGGVIPGATIVAAITLAPFSAGTAHLALAGISFVATATMILLAPVISRQYGKTLVEFLQRRGARKLPSVSLPALELEPAILEDLLALLASADPEKVELAARLLERTGDKRVIHLMREAMVSTRSGKVVRALLGQNEVVRNASIAAILVGRMQESGAPDPGAGEVPLAVLAEHLATRGAVFHDVLEALSRHPDPRVAVEAVRFHLRQGKGQDRLSWLQELLASDSPADRGIAARGLAASGDRNHIDSLARLLEDRATAGAAFAALEELDRRPDAARLALYARSLSRGDVAARRSAFRLIARGPAADGIPLVVELLGRREPMIVRESVAYLDRRWEDALPWLDRAMADPRTPSGARLEILSAWVRWRQLDRVDAALVELRRLAGRMVRWRESLPAGPSEDPVPGFLRAVLGQRLDELKHLIARGHLERSGGSDNPHVVAGLASSDTGVKSRALEALREALPAGEAGVILPFFEIADGAELLKNLRDIDHGAPFSSVLDELSRCGDPFLESGARYHPGRAAAPAEGAMA